MARAEKVQRDPIPELPGKVLDLLSVHGPVKLTTGDRPNVVTAHVAPLLRQLDVLVPARSPAVRDVLGDGRAELFADSPEYLIRVKARATAGRRVAGEPRRSELVHWLPEGANPSEWVAIHVFPEWLEYSQKVGERTRAMGSIPGVTPLRLVRRWWDLAFHRFWPLLFLVLAVDWVWALVLHPPTRMRWVATLLVLLSSTIYLGAAGLFDEWSRWTRWREGIESLSDGPLARGWEGADRVLTVSRVAFGVATILALVAGASFGWDFALCAFVGGGMPLLGPSLGLRHLLRRSDAGEGAE